MVNVKNTSFLVMCIIRIVLLLAMLLWLLMILNSIPMHYLELCRGIMSMAERPMKMDILKLLSPMVESRAFT